MRKFLIKSFWTFFHLAPLPGDIRANVGRQEYSARPTTFNFLQWHTCSCYMRRRGTTLNTIIFPSRSFTAAMSMAHNKHSHLSLRSYGISFFRPRFYIQASKIEQGANLIFASAILGPVHWAIKPENSSYELSNASFLHCTDICTEHQIWQRQFQRRMVRK